MASWVSTIMPFHRPSITYSIARLAAASTSCARSFQIHAHKELEANSRCMHKEVGQSRSDERLRCVGDVESEAIELLLVKDNFETEGELTHAHRLRVIDIFHSVGLCHRPNLRLSARRLKAQILMHEKFMQSNLKVKSPYSVQRHCGPLQYQRATI